MNKDKKMHPVARYFLNIALAIDQLANAHAGGDPRETISGRLGKIQRAHNGEIPWYRPIGRYIAWGLEIIDEDHCEEAIDDKVGEYAVFDRYKPYQDEGVKNGY